MLSKYYKVSFHMLNFFNNIVRIFLKRQDRKISYPKEIQGFHDCGPRALYTVLPNIPIKEMVNAFTNCCDRWPYGGISNKEFNITLSHLRIKNKFQYFAPESLTLNKLIEQNKDIFIALVFGHYVVVQKGNCIEKHYSLNPHKTKVYCYWKLK